MEVTLMLIFFLILSTMKMKMFIIHLFKKIKHWNLGVIGYLVRTKFRAY